MFYFNSDDIMIKITPPKWFIYVFYTVMFAIIILFFFFKDKELDVVNKDIVSTTLETLSGVTNTDTGIVLSGNTEDSVIQPIDYVYNAIENNTGIFVLSYQEQGNIAITKDGINNYISGLVSATDGNGIDKIIFVRQR